MKIHLLGDVFLPSSSSDFNYYIFMSTLFTISWENVLTSARKHETKQRETPCLAHPQVDAQSLIPFIYELQSTKHVNNFTNNCIYLAKNKRTTQVIYLQCLSLHSFCIFSNNLQNIPAKEKHKQWCHQTKKIIQKMTFQGLKKVKE